MDAVTETTGAVAISIYDLVTWLKSNSTAVATPLAYSQSDTFKYTAEEAVWGELNGIDGTFIPGLINGN